MWDYGCHALWHFGGPEVGNIDPESLPLSATTKARLEAWAAIPETKLDHNYPPDTAWTKDEKLAFEAEGRQLWKDLQRELGKGYRVVYHSSTEHRVLIPEDEHAA